MKEKKECLDRPDITVIFKQIKINKQTTTSCFHRRVAKFHSLHESISFGRDDKDEDSSPIPPDTITVTIPPLTPPPPPTTTATNGYL